MFHENSSHGDGGLQASDTKITSWAGKSYIVVSGAYGLASLCFMKGCFCISFSGMYITNKNIDELLVA